MSEILMEGYFPELETYEEYLERIGYDGDPYCDDCERDHTYPLCLRCKKDIEEGQRFCHMTGDGFVHETCLEKGE